MSETNNIYSYFIVGDNESKQYLFVIYGSIALI